MTNDLPPGWTWATIDELCDVILGQSPPGSSYNGRGEGIPFFQGKAEFGDRFPSIRKWTTEPKKHAPAGSVLLSVRAPVGPTNVAPVDCAVGRGLAAIRPLGSMSTEYLLWAVRHSVDELVKQATGSTFEAITGRQLRSHRVAVAPLAQQERIVAAIEEHFSRLDAAATALSAAQRRLDALLPSALRTLCDGSWIQLPLAHIIKSLKNGVFVSRPSTTPPGHPIYRISAVRPLMLRIDDVRYANPVPNGASSYAVEAGDILFTRYSGNPDYVGAAAVVPHEGAGVLHPDKLIRVIADRDVALPEWIAAYVTAGTGRREVEKRLKTTAGQVGISGSQLGSVPIAVPPMSYQQQATDRIGHVLAEQTRIRQILSSTETTVGSLRRSILSVAFSGRMVPQDPTDEPASVLLERIAASRTAKPKRQKVKA